SLRECDVVAICVPTPLDVFKQPDLSYVIRSTEEIAKRLHNDMLVVLESTTYPGTTEDVMKPILEETGLVCGKDFYLAFSPERVDPGNLRFKTKNTPKIVGGYGDLSTKIAKSLYEKVLDASVFTVSSPKEAEMAKVLENTFRIVNIALINEMAIVSERMGINLWEVIDAAATKPFGFMPFYPGPGVGGHCIPIDPFYLTYIARKYDYHTRLIEAAGEINDAMPQYVVERLMKLLNLERKCLNGAKIIMLGIAYKGDIDDMRESPALKVLELLEGAKAEVTVIDPYVTAFKWKDGLRKTDPLQRDQLGEADAVVITTAHKNGVDYRTVCEEARLVFDTKNILKTLDVDRSRVFVL
ncbi:MAG TPA: nucleotide sugar dehydrogenase, partial [Thermotogota bacterium]|nr:nucleotide sugar dehydrogenase [Thermotogota bacterium]